MLKYVVILLDRQSAPFCHADCPHTDSELMPLDTLKRAIFWAMTENLMIQFVYPDRDLPAEYLDVIDTIDHVDIRSGAAPSRPAADILVFNSFAELSDIDGKAIVIRAPWAEVCVGADALRKAMARASHVSLVIKDVERMTDADREDYKALLAALTDEAEKLIAAGTPPQVNVLTDRLLLDKMNNCNAGWESVTIAPNGRFYVCPAFYYDDEADSVGSLETGLDIKNPQLYRLDHAPICRECDAYQCRRCVWLNRRTTLEVNTPGREQCMAAHLERNASRALLEKVRRHGVWLEGRDIPAIDYLDPFDKIPK